MSNKDILEIERAHNVGTTSRKTSDEIIYDAMDVRANEAIDKCIEVALPLLIEYSEYRDNHSKTVAANLSNMISKIQSLKK